MYMTAMKYEPKSFALAPQPSPSPLSPNFSSVTCHLPPATYYLPRSLHSSFCLVKLSHIALFPTARLRYKPSGSFKFAAPLPTRALPLGCGHDEMADEQRDLCRKAQARRRNGQRPFHFNYVSDGGKAGYYNLQPRHAAEICDVVLESTQLENCK